MLDSGQVLGDEAVERCHLFIASGFCVPLVMVSVRQDLKRVVAVASSFKRGFPRCLVLFSHDVIVEFSKERKSRRLELLKRRCGIIEIEEP